MKHLPGIMALTVFILLTVIGPGCSQTDTPESRARTLFTQFVALGKAFDPALADLYADDARIMSVRKYPNGTQRTLDMRGAEYKALIREVMPIAKARGDTNTYADISYQREGSRIRIRATRVPALKQYASPYSLVVGPDALGRWLIYEERSMTKP
jgi:ketosteroid isomerase-like protein